MTGAEKEILGMCGIAGFQGKFDRALLEDMNAVQAHRGPDGQGVFCDTGTGTGLAHRRLAIIDLSDSGKQPMWDSTGRLVIVYNGELYNYQELRKNLLDDGLRFRTVSDTEVVLNLYLRHGPAMLDKMKGIFALALWDREESSLLLARDHLGVKPLYYAHCHKGFLFASEIKALLMETSLQRTLNPEAIRHYVSFLWCPAPQTALTDVRKLRPGHAMIVRETEITREWQFYDLPYSQPIRDIGPKDAAEELRNRLQESVRRQMVADVQVGAFLSGGLDSSSIVAMAVRATETTNIPCFTIGIEGGIESQQGISEDLPYARKVARFLGVPLKVIQVRPDRVDLLEHLLYHLDEPQADLAPINAFLISKLARENGIKVLLSGAGGDDILTGYRRHFALILERYWSWLPRPARRLMKSFAAALPKSSSRGRRFAKAFQFADLDENDRLVSYFHWIDSQLREELLGPLTRQAGLPGRDPLLATLDNIPHSVPRLNRMLYLEAKHFLTDHNLNYTDKASMAHGVEVRVPFLDPDLIEFVASLPLGFKQRGSQGKWILKKAMEPLLPLDVIRRPKTGFGMPLRQWLGGALRSRLDDLLSVESLNDRGLFDPAAVQRALKLHRAGRIDIAFPLLSLVSIELWCRVFVDGSPRDLLQRSRSCSLGIPVA